MGKEREKHWKLTYERANEIYEYIQSSLDPDNWEVIVKSEFIAVLVSHSALCN